MRAPECRRFVRCFMMILLVTVIGCGTPDDPEQSHDHADDVLRLTGWSLTTEAYLEHPPLWAGRDVGFMINVTSMVDGSPRSGGSVTLYAVDSDGGAATATANSPLRPGVYAAVLTIPQPGDWRLSLEVDGDRVELGVVMVHADEETAEHARLEAQPVGIEFLKEQQWRLGVRSLAVAPELFLHTVRVPGTVVAPPDRRAVVASPLEGRLDQAPGRALPLPGDMVSAGETLAVVLPPFTGAVAAAADAEAAVVRAASAVRLAAGEQDRVSTLAAEGAASARRLQEADAELDGATAELVAAKLISDSYRAAGLDVAVDGSLVRLISPVSGIITEIHASLGENVAAGGPVFTVLDPTVVWLRGRVPETDMLQLGGEPTASFRLPGSSGAPRRLGESDGLVYLSQEVDPTTRTAPIIFRHVNDDGLRVGMAVELLVQTSREERALVLPREALVDEDGEVVVFVQLDGEIFEKRHVKVGGDDGERVVIRSGLIAGERVVVASAYSILLAQAGTAVPAHGHTH